MIKWMEARLLRLECTQHALQYVILWCAVKAFNFVMAYRPEKELRAVHFANSEADMNNSVRSYVEHLDERIEKRN